MNEPKYWYPDISTVAGKLLHDLIQGYSVWIPKGLTREKAIEFDANIVLLRCIGWPVVGQHGPIEADGLKYTMPEHVRDEAIREIFKHGAQQS